MLPDDIAYDPGFTVRRRMGILPKFVHEDDQAEAADHHPDMTINYRRVTLVLSTHSAGGLTAKDFGHEQAIALNQTTGGSGKSWEMKDESLKSIYNNIVISQNPASFNPSSVGLGRSGAGYAADLRGYKPTAGRSADAAKALLRSQMAAPAEQEYAGTATKFKDDSEFMFDPGVEEQMAARRSQKTQGMQGADSAAELARRTRNLAGERKTELED